MRKRLWIGQSKPKGDHQQALRDGNASLRLEPDKSRVLDAHGLACWLLNEQAFGGSLFLYTFVYAEWVKTGNSDIGADHSATRKFAKASTTMAKEDLWRDRLALRTLRLDQRKVIGEAAEG